ncbi:MAG: FAD-binding oxidoreductase [Gammaproteobacteria bacterium]
MSDLITELERIVRPGGLVMEDDLRSRAASTTDVTPHAAIALVRPKTTEELSKIMALCHQHGQPVVVQGGLTGLVGGAVAGKDELAISLEQMNEIESIDTAGRTITVAAGVTIQSVQEKAAENGLLFPVDWGARGSAMVGGAIATNAGGNSVLRFGMMREQVLGLEVVLADGTILTSMNTLLKNNAGYDLKQLFIGSEGTLGIITRAVFRLQSAPQSYLTALVAVSTFANVTDLLGRLATDLADALSAYEVMWQEHYEMVVEEGGHQWVLPAGYPYYIVIEMIGAHPDTDAERFESVLAAAMEAELITDAVLCSSHSQRDAVWGIREDVDTFMRVLHPPIPYDVSLPITAMEPYVVKVRAEMHRRFPQARGTAFGHLGDNNLHFCWSVGSDAPEDIAEVSRIVYENLLPFNGSVSAEHGIGLAKRKYLGYSRSDEEIHWMKQLKRLFDPDNLLNPGRIIDIE